MAEEHDLASWETRGKGQRRPSPRRDERRGVRRRRWLIVAGAVTAVILLLVIFSPTIGAAIAPGMVASSISKDIAGDVRIDSMSLNWFGHTRLHDVTLLDPDGGEVATLSVDAPVSVWRALTEAWWSRRHLELGRVVVTGDATIIREPDGSTNLTRAIAPTGPEEPSQRDAFKGVLRLDGVDVTVAARAPGGKLDESTRSGLRDISGEVAFEFDKRRGKELTAKGELEAALSGEAAEAGQKMAIGVDVKGVISAAGSLMKSKGSIRASRAPVAVLDVLGGFGGALRQVMGPAATAQADFQGDLRAGEAHVTLESEGATADIRAKLIDGVLAVQEGAEARLASTAGLERLPAVAGAFARAGQRVRISSAPGATITIRSARAPIAPMIEKGVSPAELDLRGAALDLSIAIDGMEGEVLLAEEASPAEGESPEGGAGEPQNGEMRLFSLDPVVINLTSQDLAQGVRVNAETAANIGSSPAGSASVDLTAKGVLTEKGRLAALVEDAAPASGLDGSVTLTDLSAALVQPIVDAIGQPIDVAADIGPAISVSLTASASGDVGGEELAAIPPTRLEILASAERATLGGALSMEQGVLRTVRDTETGAGLIAHLSAAGPLARRIAGEALAARLQGAVPIEVQVTDLTLPLSPERMMQDLVADVTVIASDASFGLVGGGAGEQDGAPAPVQVRQVRLSGAVSPQSPARVDLEASLSHEDAAFLVRGQIDLTGVQGAAAVQEALAIRGPGMLERLRPSGQVMATGVPGSVLEAIGLKAGEAEGAAHQAMLALSEALGQSADASVTFDPGGEGKAPVVVVRASGERAGVDVALAAREGAVAVREATAQLTVSAVRATALLDAATGGNEAGAAAPAAKPEAQPAQAQAPSRPFATVAAEVPLVATVEPITLPMEGWLPRGGTDAAAVVSVRTGGPVRLEHIQGREQEITMVIADAQGQVSAPVATLLSRGGEQAAPGAQPMRASLSASIQDGKGEAIGAVNGEATVAPDRTLQQARLVVDEIDTFRMDDMLGAKGAVSGLLGDTATLRAALTPESETLSTIDMEILAPNVSGAALTMKATEREIALTDPVKITWVVQPAAANHFLGMGGTDAGALVEPLTARINLDNLALAVPSQAGEGRAVRGPLAPDVFALGATLQFERLMVRATETEIATLSGIRASVGSAPEPGTITFQMDVAGVTGEQGAEEGASAIRGSVSNLANARGVLTPELASIDAQGALSQFPTALADAIASQKGLLLAALGPTASVRVDVVDLTRDSGRLSAALRSERADASVSGYVQEGRFITTAPLQVRLTEIHPELVGELAGSLPVISTLEKTSSQAPGILRTEGLQVPIDGDISKLNGTVTVDLGEVNFATRPIFGEFIKALGGQQQGTIGQSIEPFTVKITNGVLEYDRYTLPLGEFAIDTRGRVDLVNRTMDIVTYVPLFALSDEAAGLFNTSLAGRIPMLDNATEVPLHTTGVIGSTDTKLDMELFLRERGRDIKNLPGNIIEGIGDVIGDGGKKDGGKKSGG